MKKTSKTKLGAMGSKIMKTAKEIRSNSPNKPWATCVKLAGKCYKKGA